LPRNDFWISKIKAFLHDPPDKALRIASHEDRRDKLLQMFNLKFDIPPEFDRIASSMERVVPKTDVLIDFSRTDKTLHPMLRHPITGEVRKFEKLSQATLGIKKTRIEQIIKEVLDKETKITERLKSEDSKKAYFRVWRLFKDLLVDEEIANLPADTRCPDHTIWDHLDASSAIYSAISEGKPALLIFKLSPVQDFIKNARKERDLWAGSHLLSFLTFQAIKVVIEECGPDAVIFPHLRGQPFFDKEYEDIFKDILEINDLKEKLKIANIPNKFLAIVSAKRVVEIKRKICKDINKELENLLEFSLEKIFDGKIDKDMKNYYLRLLQNYFNITICSISADLNVLMDIVKGLPSQIRKKYEEWISLLEKSGYKTGAFDLYSLMFELIEEIAAIESRKFFKLKGLKKEKCSLCGNLEIIGNRDVWKDVDRYIFKENERLCPICLIKRMYHEWIYKKWGIKVEFDSVSEIALRRKIEGKDATFYDVIKDMKVARDIGCENLVKTFRENISKILDNLNLPINYELAYKENLTSVKAISNTLGVNEQRVRKIPNVEGYLRNARSAVAEIEKLIGEFPKYYSILLMDGDNMGKMLVGDDMKSVENYLHPEVLGYLSSEVKDKVKRTKRLITPATHSAISRALMHFSVNIVPKIVKKCRGEVIYAGGDDILALLPVDSSLHCAYKIQNIFGRDWDGWELLPAKTMSGSILIVHYKHPLYDALDRVRSLEKKAKELGRNAVAVGYLARRGSYYEVVANWDVIKILNNICTDSDNENYNIVELIKRSKKDRKSPYLSERLTYNIILEIDNLPDNEEAIKQFLKWEFPRHYYDENVKRKKMFLEHIPNRIIECAKNMRVRIEKSELERFISKKLQRSYVRKINEVILGLIENCKLSPKTLQKGLKSDKKEIKGLEEILEITDSKFYEKLYGLILKKQIKDLFILLKILVDCNVELGGEGYEDSNRT